MKFTGKELFDLGVPKNKIKFFVGREFSSIDELKEELIPKTQENSKLENTWLEFIWDVFPHLPMLIKGDEKTGIPIKMSKSELKRLMDNKAVLINGNTPSSRDVKDEFCEEIIFFPNSDKHRNTLFKN